MKKTIQIVNKMRYVPVSKRRTYIFLSVAVLVSTAMTFILLPYLFDYETNDRDFNSFLKHHNMRNNKIVVNSVGKEILQITSAASIISRHAYSYKDGGENLALPWFIDMFIGPVMNEVTRSQYTSLNEQIKHGATELDIRLSKLNDGSIVVDHGVVYGTAKEFMEDLHKCDIGSNTIKVHYRSSGYTPQRISNVEMERELSKWHTNNNIELHYSDYRDWAIKDSSDFMEILTLLQSDKEYKVLTVYRSAGEIVRIAAIVLSASFVTIVLLGWIVFIVTSNTKSEDE